MFLFAVGLVRFWFCWSIVKFGGSLASLGDIKDRKTNPEHVGCQNVRLLFAGSLQADAAVRKTRVVYKYLPE